MTVVCIVCGKSFYKPGHRCNRTKTGLHYCSRECYKKQPVVTQERTGKEVVCENCGKIFYRSGATLGRSISGKHFCSKKCRGNYVSRLSSNDHNSICLWCGKLFHSSPSTSRKFCSRDCWKIGIRSSGPSFYRLFKKEECELCGFIPKDRCQLDVHHIDKNKKNNEESNLMTVCANCHRLLHNGGGACEL